MVAQRKAIESLFEDTCSVYEQTEYVDGGRTRKTLACIYRCVPCRLSFSSISASVAGDGADKISQSAKLFVLPDCEIKAGSRVHIVRASGAESDWSMTGEPATYQTHLEYVLTPLKRYA